MAKNAQQRAALAEPLQYPGRMSTYPGQVKGQPAVFVHDCVAGCPGMAPRPIMPVAGTPEEMAKLANPYANESTALPDPHQFKHLNPGAHQFPGQLGLPPGPPPPGAPPAVGAMIIGKQGEQIFFHPHYRHLKANTCDTCKHVIPIRPPKFSSKLTKDQIAEFQECFQMFDKDGDGTIDTGELGAVMRSLGQFPDMEEIEEMVDEADEDGSGSINFPEFVGLMLKRREGGQTREEIKQVNTQINTIMVPIHSKSSALF